MIRRFGHRPLSGHLYRPRPGVYAVLVRGSSLLITHQSQPVPEFQLPGGGIDPGESPLTALHREVWEETGWRIGRPRRLGAFRRFVYMPEYDLMAEKLCTIYAATPVRRLGDPIEPDHTALWLPAEDAVPRLANSGDRHFAALASGVVLREKFQQNP